MIRMMRIQRGSSCPIDKFFKIPFSLNSLSIHLTSHALLYYIIFYIICSHSHTYPSVSTERFRMIFFSFLLITSCPSPDMVSWFSNSFYYFYLAKRTRSHISTPQCFVHHWGVSLVLLILCYSVRSSRCSRAYSTLNRVPKTSRSVQEIHQGTHQPDHTEAIPPRSSHRAIDHKKIYLCTITGRQLMIQP